MSVCEAVCNAVAKKEAEKKEDVDEISDDMREAPSEVVDMVLFKGDLHNNRVNSALFSGIKFLLSPSLESNAAVVRALGVCGGKVVVSPHEKLGDVLRSSVTHVLYDQSEKKCALLIEAASVKKTVPGLVLAQFNWAEDCMMLKELIPPYGPYAPSAKLLDTLEKKHRKRSEL
uniref:Uncharacterized protein TCIL3000_9_3550 n=1 Tax=Trypanosoma congolense (strain IL3000) TaxID=1068625 RepID=G0UU94_TRYCI|nr:unnamed protein product [Trypanosoma congolense IL3000]